jgi:hypothetical protein
MPATCVQLNPAHRMASTDAAAGPRPSVALRNACATYARDAPAPAAGSTATGRTAGNPAAATARPTATSRAAGNPAAATVGSTTTGRTAGH